MEYLGKEAETALIRPSLLVVAAFLVVTACSSKEKEADAIPVAVEPTPVVQETEVPPSTVNGDENHTVEKKAKKKAKKNVVSKKKKKK